jgi:hypothetical protein
MAKLIRSVRVDPPEHPYYHHERVQVLFYDDGSYRFRIPNATPLVIEEAFLTGKRKTANIKLANTDRALTRADSLLRRVEQEFDWASESGKRWSLLSEMRGWRSRFGS